MDDKEPLNEAKSVKSQGRYSFRSRDSRDNKLEGEKNKYLMYEGGTIGDLEDWDEEKSRRKKKNKKHSLTTLGKRTVQVIFALSRGETGVQRMSPTTTTRCRENTTTTRSCYLGCPKRGRSSSSTDTNSQTHCRNSRKPTSKK